MSDAGPHRSTGSPKAQRKSNVPKAKGAVRAKSGCYTCRIRRKKCDEKSDADGNCETCVRLRLQCLGFGAKRPEWMRENNSVSELRERIKAFLAAQGMIKGHSGSGPRTAEQDPPVLVLSGDPNSSTPSPPTHTLSTSSGDSPRPSGLVTSNVREGPMQYSPDTHPYNLPPLNYHQQQLSPDSPISRSGPLVNPELMLPGFGSHSQILNQSSLVPLNSSHWRPATPNIFYPPIESSFSRHYHPAPEQWPDDEDADMTGASDYRGMQMIQAPMHPALTPYGDGPDSLVQHYMANVLGIQYILADPWIKDFIYKLAHHGPAYQGMCFLASVHRNRMRGMLREPDEIAYHDNTRRALELELHKGKLTESDALAGLHCVSSFLFSGGRGPWEFFLNVACRWLQETLQNPNRTSRMDVLYHSPESTRFIMRTTMWFDVLASVTQCRSPRFLSVYKELFGRRTAWIEETVPSMPSFSMRSVMGCDNSTFLAIAEISALAEWKEQQLLCGSLSTPLLVERGLEIEKDYLSDDLTDVTATNGFSDMNTPGLEERRRLTADVFRASARVYLHSILSGDHPNCPEIAKGVKDTIQALKRVPELHSVSRSVVRSVIFPICICGCLTDDLEQREFIQQKLADQQRESVGNCSEAQKVIETVWKMRDQGIPVSWRDVMKKKGPELLLLV